MQNAFYAAALTEVCKTLSQQIWQKYTEYFLCSDSSKDVTAETVKGTE